MQIGNASTHQNFLNKIAFHSITGIDASGHISQSHKTEVQSDTTATRFHFDVYLYASSTFFAISKHGSATHGVYHIDKSS